MNKKKPTRQDYLDKVRKMKAFKVTPRVNEGTLINRHKFPVTVSYNGVGLVIPAKGRLVLEDKSKLGALPVGVLIK